MHDPHCIFCKIVKGEAPSWKVYENDSVYAFLDINPVTKYHTLVIPKNHYRNIFDTPAEELREIVSTIKRVATLYQDKLGIHNLQLVNSNGTEAQQDVFHIHFHIVPRRIGDGQNIRWTPHPEWRNHFDDWLIKLK
ncbi:MAG: HIT family protein [Bacteroidota bacterium]